MVGLQVKFAAEELVTLVTADIVQTQDVSLDVELALAGEGALGTTEEFHLTDGVVG